MTSRSSNALFDIKQCPGSGAFAETKPKPAVFTPLVLLASEQVAAVTADKLIAKTRKIYNGPLQIGEDLMSFDNSQRADVHRSRDRQWLQTA